MPYYRSGNVRLSYTADGNGTPCVLLHGSFVDGTFWKKQTTDFRKDFKVIVPDLRGHGLSDKPECEYTPQVMAQDIYDLVRELGIKQTSIVGHSLGCRIALQFVLSFPKMVEKLVLANGNAGPVTPRVQNFPEHVREEIGFGTPQFNLDKFNYYEILASFVKPDSYEVRWIAEKILGTPDYVKYSVGKHFSSLDLRPRLNEIQVPTLVIVGEKDVICPVKVAEEMAQLLTDSRLVVVPDSGHCLPIEKAQAFNESVLSFLNTGK